MEVFKVLVWYYVVENVLFISLVKSNIMTPIVKKVCDNIKAWIWDLSSYSART